MRSFISIFSGYKKIISLFSVLFVSVSVFAYGNIYEVKFVKGNLVEKKQAVIEAGKAGNTSLALRSLRFCLDSRLILENDADLNKLVLESLNVLISAKSDSSSDNFEYADVFSEVFKNFDSNDVKVKVLTCLQNFPSDGEIVSLVNNYVSVRMQTAEVMDEVLLTAIKGLGSYGNSTSFKLLFIADILNVWPGYEEILEESYGVLSEASEKEILHILSSVPINKKILILEKVNKNPKISNKICGEIAENALSQSIYNTGDNSEISNELLFLQKLAFNIIADTKWTRAAALANNYFGIARNQFEKGLISAEDFSLIIKNMVSVASSDTGYILSSYLNVLNKSAELNQSPDRNVVLSVINALGELGDKTAFDYLLYVTYLDYPEEITIAARKALAKLKW